MEHDVSEEPAAAVGGDRHDQCRIDEQPDQRACQLARARLREAAHPRHVRVVHHLVRPRRLDHEPGQRREAALREQLVDRLAAHAVPGRVRQGHDPVGLDRDLRQPGLEEAHEPRADAAEVARRRPAFCHDDARARPQRRQRLAGLERLSGRLVAARVNLGPGPLEALVLAGQPASVPELDLDGLADAQGVDLAAGDGLVLRRLALVDERPDAEADRSAAGERQRGREHEVRPDAHPVHSRPLWTALARRFEERVAPWTAAPPPFSAPEGEGEADPGERYSCAPSSCSTSSRTARKSAASSSEKTSGGRSFRTFANGPSVPVSTPRSRRRFAT